MALSDRVRQRIERARQGGWTDLNLAGTNLFEFPKEILGLKALHRIDLGNNRLRHIPDEIHGLSNLEFLWLDGNPIEQLPDIPGLGLDETSYLRLRDSLSEENIRGLLLQHPGGSSMAYLLGALPHLEELYAFSLQISELPAELGRLAGLRELVIHEAPLLTVPHWLTKLQRLKIVRLQENRFGQFPEPLLELTKLEEVNLSSHTGGIEEIPRGILRLKKLKALTLAGHPVQTPPSEVAKQGIKAIRNYWRQQLDVGVDHLCEAKLLILGEPDAGKTSLAKKIQDAGYVLQPTEKSTKGIVVAPWTFPCTVRGQSRDFRVNIWDFGGQEIYHATHQFFLTRRSLYVIVADDRKEDTDFNYWLDVIELLSDGSPVLVVQNEKQDRRRDIDFGPLRARFANLRQSYRVNLADNRGLDEAVRAIRSEMEQLPHIGEELPKTWKRVRDALEQDRRDYISQEQYFEICQDNGFRRTEDKLQLSAYLHDLGICLHFQDDPVLQHTVILKPKWGTDAVYLAIDDKGFFTSHGRFQPADLDRIWSDDRYTGKRHELLRLMMKFQLCYQVPETDTFIAPQLLPVNQPGYEWPGGPNLIVRYEYDFMPKGFITRLIVALHHRIADQDLVWRSGAIFQRDATRAEVIEDYARRRIGVRTNGPDARGLFTIIDDQLDRIHATFPKLKFEKHVPCNCAKCVDDPYLFPLSELKEFAKEGEGIQCRRSKKLVDAAALLLNLFPSESRFFRPQPRTVFVSYRQTEESIRLVDQIESVLRDHKIDLLRDRNEVGYRESFKRYMERLGDGDAVILVLSNEYFESENCMFELTEIASRGGIPRRVYPILLRNTKLFKPEDRTRIVKYWETRLDELKEQNAYQDLGEIARYQSHVGEILYTLAGTHMLEAGDTFKPIVDQLERLIAP